MASDLQRQAHQNADLDQINDQKVEQGNSQDASHQSEQKVAVTIQNHITGPFLQSGQVDGRITTVDGNSVAQCVVEIFFGALTGVPVAVEETDSLGRFQVLDLPPGFYSIRATGPDGTVVQQWNLRVRPEETCRVQLCLQMPVALHRHSLSHVMVKDQ